MSLSVLIAAVGGLPLLLAWATPVIWASSHDNLAHLLDRQDTGSVFLLILVAVGWAGWAQFTFCALRELAAQLRGRRWHAPRGLGTAQRAAALLVGSILVVLPAGSALASDAHAATAAPIPEQTSVSVLSPSADQSAGVSASDAGSSYVVRETRPAESLWSIAERELGDGERWREISELNAGRTMSDGRVFESSSFLQPGWKLVMPDSAQAGKRPRTEGHKAVPADSEEHRVVTVHTGDSLSKIAEAELGDGTEWPMLFDASEGKVQPGGLPAITSPDLIYAGQRVTIPSARVEPPAPSPGSPNSPGREPSSATPVPHENEPTGDTESDEAGPPPTASGTNPTRQPGSRAPSHPTDGATADHTAAPVPSAAVTEPAPASPLLNLRTVFGAGALLAAAVTSALALRRTLQRRRRKPGETISIASEATPVEQQLAAAAEPSGAARLDRALRTMVRAAEQDGRPTPLLRAARIDTRTLHVLPDVASSEPQLPFAAGEAGWWRLDDDAELVDETETPTIPGPHPALVTVGSTPSGDLVLADLTQLPVLLLDGNPVHVSEVCTSLALELGMSPWARDVEVIVVGFGEELPNLLPHSRIAYMRQPEHALRDLTERLLEVHQMPETAHHPYVVLCASPLTDDTAWQFADVLGKGNLPIATALVAPVGTTACHFPEAEILAVSAQGPQHFDAVGVDITVQRLEDAAYQQIITALAVSGQPACPAEGAWQHVPAEPDVTKRGVESPQTVPSRASTSTPAAAQAGSNDAGADTDNAVFPALLKASTDPAALPPLSMTSPVHAGAQTTPSSGQDRAEEDATATATDRSQSVRPATGWGDEQTTPGVIGPQIRVLGTVEVDGVGRTGHGPRIAQLAALLYFRPGRTADALCTDMDPLSPWSTSTLNARLQGLRRALGSNADGDPYVPRRSNGVDPYRLADAVRCDWTRFLTLAEHSLPLGPAGLPELEEALSAVRGRPFGTRAPAWAGPLQQEMITRIVDVAHTIATHRTRPGPHHDLHAARKAIATGLDVDESAELLYRDWLVIESTAGNRPGLHAAVTRLQQVTQALDCDLELETEQLIQDLLTTSPEAPTS
ncbi:hypothetical protein [Streptomyces sp. NPDC048643]|uniref:hypothetical protein n=1 Tax=Streptomyces sp. NPDC048643 TaxID=3155637 RepID=UPI00341AC291